LGWLALAAVLTVALLVGVTQRDGDESKADRAQDVAGQLMCPNCKGQSVADSASPASNGIRKYINTRIDQGASNDEIVDELRIQYGDDIVLTPEKSGIASLVWTLPVAALVAACVGLGFAFRRWRHRSVLPASDADRALVESARGG
jgi:cytochrome c-type biogenesis protein CcmH/NrfF